jgi:glutaryl-CoA dehydrogenase
VSEDIGRSLGTDYLLIRDQLRDEEIDYLERTRAFVDEDVLPVAADYGERGDFPWALLEKMAPLAIVGDGIEGYGLSVDESDCLRTHPHGAQPR